MSSRSARATPRTAASSRRKSEATSCSSASNGRTSRTLKYGLDAGTRGSGRAATAASSRRTSPGAGGSERRQSMPLAFEDHQGPRCEAVLDKEVTAYVMPGLDQHEQAKPERGLPRGSREEQFEPPWMVGQEQPDARGHGGGDRQGLLDGRADRAKQSDERMVAAEEPGSSLDRSAAQAPSLRLESGPPSEGWGCERMASVADESSRLTWRDHTSRGRVHVRRLIGCIRSTGGRAGPACTPRRGRAQCAGRVVLCPRCRSDPAAGRREQRDAPTKIAMKPLPGGPRAPPRSQS